VPPAQPASNNEINPRISTSLIVVSLNTMRLSQLLCQASDTAISRGKSPPSWAALLSSRKTIFVSQQEPVNAMRPA
jgi:hypothetical protein